MEIVDAHCHVSPFWYEPVESLIYHMNSNDIANAVLVQYMGQYYNDYLFNCCRRFPGRFTVVVLVDPSRPDALKQIESFAKDKAAGIRLRADARSPGSDELAIWRRAAQLGLSVSCSGTNKEFADERFFKLVQELPFLRIVIEHLGSINKPDGEEFPYSIRRHVFSLARFPNVYLKFHGLGELVSKDRLIDIRNPSNERNAPLLKMAYDSFGAGRLMWGSDFPLVCGREGYKNALCYPVDYFRSCSKEEKNQMFGSVAREIFRFY